jgi:hypothetical protein
VLAFFFTEGNDMSSPQRPGGLIVSVDVDSDELRGDLNMQRALNSSGVALMGVLANHGVAGTWALSDPARSLITERLIADGLPHELALLGESSWAGPEMGRVRFFRELAGRVQEASDKGLKLETLALREAHVPHYDLLVRSGVCALRNREPERSASSWWRSPIGAPNLAQPQALRWGLWKISATWHNFTAGLMSSRRGVDRSISTGGLITWVLDGPKLVLGGQSMLRLVDRVLAYATRRREEGLLRIETVQGFVSRQRPKRETAPAESILRAA